jgi:hypothetical protein
MGESVMKKIALTLILLSIACSALLAQQLELFKTIELNTEALKKNYKYYSTEFRSGNKKKLSTRYCFDLSEIIKNSVKELPKNERNNLVIIAAMTDGSKVSFSYRDFDGDLLVIPPMWIAEEVTGSIGDTIMLPDIDGKEGTVDVDFAMKEFDVAVKKRVYLQVPNPGKKLVKKFFRHGTIVFPQDKIMDKWLIGVTDLKIYKLK